MKKLDKKLVDLFWSRVDVRSPDECWLWTSYNSKGYGQITYKQVVYRATRLSLMIHGVDPGKLFACHKCDNPTCVNPAHLFLGTANDNTRDRVRKWRGARGERHPNAILTEEIVLAMRSEYAANPVPGETKRIAQRYGVDRTLVNGIVARRSWKHI